MDRACSPAVQATCERLADAVQQANLGLNQTKADLDRLYEYIGPLYDFQNLLKDLVSSDVS